MMNSKLPRTLEEEDRLSILPDGIISHILSFLPTKFAATTSVLSKRWRFLFHSVSQIDLDEAWESTPNDQRERLRNLFHEFLHRLLISPEPSHLHKFRLKCNPPLKSSLVGDWIRAAINRNVEDLEIVVSLGRLDKLPQEIYYSKYLKSLTLCGDFLFHSVRMPNLMNLHLESVRFTDGSCFLKTFPALKHLELCDCKVDNDEVIEIVAPSLENLILRRRHQFFKVALSTPNLVCLSYSAHLGFVEVKENMTFLARADIDFQLNTHTDTALNYGRYAKMIIRSCQNVRTLSLSGASLKVLYDSPCSWPTFHNLNELKLGVDHRVGWKILAKLLECSPNLQVLDFYQGFIDRTSSYKLEFEYNLPEIVPACLSQNLRQIKIGDFVGKDCEFELVEYFLWRGEALVKIRIRSLTFWNWPSSFCRRLLACSRCSETCKIILSWKADGNFCKRTLNAYY